MWRNGPWSSLLLIRAASCTLESVQTSASLLRNMKRTQKRNSSDKNVMNKEMEDGVGDHSRGCRGGQCWGWLSMSLSLFELVIHICEMISVGYWDPLIPCTQKDSSPQMPSQDLLRIRMLLTWGWGKELQVPTLEDVWCIVWSMFPPHKPSRDFLPHYNSVPTCKKIKEHWIWRWEELHIWFFL